MVEERTQEAQADVSLLQIGQKIGNYRIVRLMGRGGMGAVYEAVHEYIERKAAIKVLLPDLSQNPQFASRFLNEARAVNLVKHPGLVEIFEFGILDGGTAYIIMQFLEGESLSTCIRRAEGGMGNGALDICRQIAHAMAAAHRKEIVHRDLKPDNVMLVADPERPGRQRVKVLDFGVAKLSGSGEGPKVTQTGTAIGTPAYMAPEQCLGVSVPTSKADVYSLGILTYEMLTGHLPFDATHAFDFMAAHVRVPPRPLRELAPSVPEPVAQLVHEMLIKEPEGRPSMEIVVARIERMDLLITSNPSMNAMALSATQAAPSLPPQMALSPSGLAAAAAAVSVPSLPPQAPQPRRRGWLPVAAGLLACVLLGAGLVRWATRPAAPPRPVAAPAAAAPRMVKWVVASKPPGATVVRVDGQVLGTTPWEMERAAGEGETVVTLRHPDCQDLSLTLSHGADLRTEVQLPPRAVPATAPVPVPAAPAEAGGKGHKGHARPAGKKPAGDGVKLLMD